MSYPNYEEDEDRIESAFRDEERRQSRLLFEKQYHIESQYKDNSGLDWVGIADALLSGLSEIEMPKYRNEE